MYQLIQNFTLVKKKKTPNILQRAAFFNCSSKYSESRSEVISSSDSRKSLVALIVAAVASICCHN